ncbi:MAG: hypothetical protein JSR78_16190 [Proteobacteria bacterium]|nr:hypothetical protein [Pseudomonadota bacterium]
MDASSAAFVECKELHAKYTSAPEGDLRDATLSKLCEAKDRLFALPPSRQKLNELLSLAVIESKPSLVEGEQYDLLSAEAALAEALQTFEALGEAA